MASRIKELSRREKLKNYLYEPPDEPMHLNYRITPEIRNALDLSRRLEQIRATDGEDTFRSLLSEGLSLSGEIKALLQNKPHESALFFEAGLYALKRRMSVQGTKEFLDIYLIKLFEDEERFLDLIELVIEREEAKDKETLDLFLGSLTIRNYARLATQFHLNHSKI